MAHSGSLYRRLLPYALRQWRILLGVALLMIAASAAAAFQPWPLKILVDYALKRETIPAPLRLIVAAVRLPETSAALIVFAATASFTLFLLNAAVDALLTLGWTMAGQRMVRDVSIDLFRGLLGRSLLDQQKSPVGDSLSRLNTDAWCVYTMTDGLFTPGQHIVQIVMISVIALKLDWKLATIALALSPLLAISSVWFGRVLKRRAKQSREIQSRLLSFVHQTLTAMPIVQAFSTEESNRQTMQSMAADAVAMSQRGAVVASAYGLVNGFILSIGMTVILWMGGVRVLAGSLSLGTLLIFLTYIRNLQNAAAGLIQTYSIMKPIEASMDRVVELLPPNDAPAAIKPASVLDHALVRFEKVTFAYTPGSPVLCEVDLEAKPGETIAIIGPSGAGKSTLVSLLLRFLDPQAGRITLNGRDIREFSIDELRGNISIVLQDSFLFPVTIRENIAYGRPDASFEEIRDAAIAARAHEFIERMPEGYDTIVGQRGSTLSGGEKQRIAIARAILKNAPILVLDEPTAALDHATEFAMLSAINQVAANRTTFLIAHRQSTIQHADRTIVLRGGSVKERAEQPRVLGSRLFWERTS